MSIPFSGTFKRSAGVTSAIVKQLNSVSLKPVNKVVFKFDPFHAKIKETRTFMHYITGPKATNTNLSCVFKTEIVCDQSEPTIIFKLANGDEVIFKSENLTTLEMFKGFNKHISILAPKETETEPSLATKAVKKASGAKTRGKKN